MASRFAKAKQSFLGVIIPGGQPAPPPSSQPVEPPSTMPPSTQRKRDNEDELQATKHDKDLDGEGQSADGESEADEGKSGEEVAGSRTPYKANDDDEGTDELDDDEDQTPADGAASLPPAEATKRASPSKTYGKKSSSKRTATKEKIGSNKGKGKAKAKNAPEQGESDETDFHSAEEGEGGDVDEACAPRTSTRTKKPTAPRRKPSTSQKSKSAASSSARSSKKRPRSPEAAAQDDEDDSEAYSAEEEDEENEDEDSPPSSKRKKKKPAAPRSSQASSSRHKQKKRRTRKGKEKGTSSPGTRTGRVFSDVEEEEEDSDAESQGGLDEDDPPNIFLHLDRRGKNWVPDKIWLHEGHWRNGVREMWERRIPDYGGELVTTLAPGVIAVLADTYSERYPDEYRKQYKIASKQTDILVHDDWLDACYNSSKDHPHLYIRRPPADFAAGPPPPRSERTTQRHRSRSVSHPRSSPRTPQRHSSSRHRTEKSSFHRRNKVVDDDGEERRKRRKERDDLAAINAAADAEDHHPHAGSSGLSQKEKRSANGEKRPLLYGPDDFA